MTDIFCQSYLSISHLSLSSNDQRNTAVMKNMMRLMKRKKRYLFDFTLLGAGATAAPLRRKGSEEIQSFSQLSNGSDLSVNPKCLTTFLDFPFFCFVSKEKILTGQQHIKTWSANGPDWRLIYVNICKSEQKRILKVGCVKTKPSQGIRESKTSSPKFLKSNSRIGRA